MKRLFIAGLAFLIITLTGCGDDSPTGPAAPAGPLETKVEITEMNPASPAALKYYLSNFLYILKDEVHITYNYSVAETDGAQIWIKPHPSKITGKITTFFSSSPVYKGAGSKKVSVTVSSEEQDTVHISQLEVLIYSPSKTDTISQAFIDVDYTFTN